MDNRELIRNAIEARERAYAPYSNFKVGAALLTKEGRVYQGCNIENAAYSPTNCAERTAFFRAVFEGEREFEKICVIGSMDGEPGEMAGPCGVCRQVMMEFCDPETFRILVAVDEDHYVEYLLKDLYPLGFGPANLGTKK